jgi:glycerol-3-phosphate acyltransferase PlsY
LRNLLWLSAAAYLAASLNFSIVLFRLLGRGDPRERFSGNAGATNVARQLGKGWALLVLLLDLARAAAFALIGVRLLPDALVPVLGLILVVANQTPLFHRFRGGKGVATYLGFTIFISPLAAGISCLAWVLAYGLFRRPFIGSFFMVAVLGLGTGISFSSAWPAVLGTGATVAFILRAHQTNLAGHRKERRRER